MIGKALRWLVILLAGTALGLGSAALAMQRLSEAGALHIGPWVTPIDGGGTGRGMYLRAATALRATLALSRAETIYFRATTDSQGARLNGACSYTIHGADLPARWWSITLYGDDHYLIANPANRYSYASANATRAPNGGFSIGLGPAAQAGDWLDTRAVPHLVLIVRLYQPENSATANPASIKMPAIDLVACP